MVTVITRPCFPPAGKLAVAEAANRTVMPPPTIRITRHSDSAPRSTTARLNDPRDTETPNPAGAAKLRLGLGPAKLRLQLEGRERGFELWLPRSGRRPQARRYAFASLPAVEPQVERAQR
jgi:hypothetical protein